jgi:hypothetical protein
MRNAKIFTIFLTIFTVIFVATEASAAGSETKPKVCSETEFIGAYGGVGTNFQTSGSFNFGFKLRYLRYLPLGLEFVDMVPYGTEIAFPLYLVHHPNFKWHIILPFTGFHIPWRETRMAVDWVKRKRDVDLVVGTGIEVQFKARGALEAFGFRYISVNLDWRMIAPSPVWILPNFGDYGKAIYRQAAKEGQLWLGVTFWY